MFDQFLIWWARQLLEIVPASLTGSEAHQGAAVIAEIGADAGTAHLRIRRNRRESSLGRVRLDGAAGHLPDVGGRMPNRRVLRIPAAMLLEKEIVLPSEVAHDWRNVLCYELPRLTPFADQVYWRGAITGRDPVRGKITVRLSIVPKAKVAPLIGALGSLGFSPDTIEVAGIGGVRSIDLAVLGANPSHSKVVRGLAGACAGLALVAILLPFIIQAHRLLVVDRRITQLQPVVAHVERLRRHLLAGSSQIDVIATERLRVGDPLTVLSAVSGALPDNTYLTELSLRRLHLSMAGESKSAAPLLAALSANPVLQDVAFSAPVTRDVTHHEDLFSIKAMIAPSRGGMQ
ncbi:MAG: hypothetical protein HIU90_16045 [Proteobacteria bacterium]|nr:hypothetical protein [Pseudomonadota bacterium]